MATARGIAQTNQKHGLEYRQILTSALSIFSAEVRLEMPRPDIALTAQFFEKYVFLIDLKLDIHNTQRINCKQFVYVDNIQS